jgi:hypothetical protein
MISWIKKRIERRKKIQQQEKEDRLKLTLVQLREVMVAIDEYLMTSKNLSRQDRRHFWDAFRKKEQMRNDVFDELLKDGDLDAKIKELTCQKKN